MNKEELAKLLDGRKYGSELSHEEGLAAEAAGLVVVFGASHDLMEFRGARCLPNFYEEKENGPATGRD